MLLEDGSQDLQLIAALPASLPALHLGTLLAPLHSVHQTTLNMEETIMEAWGIIMTALTMFGMLALTMISATMDDGLPSTDTQREEERSAQAEALKEAA
jgi:hypothetical protein